MVMRARMCVYMHVYVHVILLDTCTPCPRESGLSLGSRGPAGRAGGADGEPMGWSGGDRTLPALPVASAGPLEGAAPIPAGRGHSEDVQTGVGRARDPLPAEPGSSSGASTKASSVDWGRAVVLRGRRMGVGRPKWGSERRWGEL